MRCRACCCAPCCRDSASLTRCCSARVGCSPSISSSSLSDLPRSRPDSASSTAVDVRPNQVFVGQVESRRRDRAEDHQFRALEEVLVVRTAGRAVGGDESGLAAAAGASAALGIVGRCRWHVAQAHGVELRDIDAKFHRRRAVEQRQFGFAELVFALDAHFGWNLSRVLLGTQAAKPSRGLSVEISQSSGSPAAGTSGPAACV